MGAFFCATRAPRAVPQLNFGKKARKTVKVPGFDHPFHAVDPSAVGRLILLLTVVMLLLGCAASSPSTVAESQTLPPPTVADPIRRLRTVSHGAYLDAIETHRSQLQAEAPIIVQRLLGMTLHRANGERIQFEMDKRRYFLMAAASHPPLAIYSILAKQGFGPINASTRADISAYRAALADARAALPTVEADEEIVERILRIFASSDHYLDSVLSTGSSSKSGFENYAAAIRPLLVENLRIGAREQLEQFRSCLETWRQEFPDENWEELRVVVLGFHQPRELYVLKQFFEWLLDEPDFEHRVVFAEFQYPIFGKQADEVEELALTLLTKVDFEQPMGALVFGNPSVMGRDVMGPAAVEILQKWGESDWP